MVSKIMKANTKKLLLATAAALTLTALAYLLLGDIALIIASILFMLALYTWFYLWRP
jgi:hypothetical protein